MANLNNLGNNLMDQILPQFGKERINTPIWNESQHMFITDQYTSESGNTYYLGIRFTDRFVSILHIGLYHNWTYINDVEVFAFNGQERVLIGKTTLDTYYNEELIKTTLEELIGKYIEGQMKIQCMAVDKDIIDKQSKELVAKSYCSMLNDPDTYQRLESIKPLLENKQ